MKVENHLLNDIKPLRLSDSIESILDVMEELKFSHLPVVDDEKSYLGTISEDDLLEVERETDLLEQHKRQICSFSMPATAHLYDAVSMLSRGKLSILPVVDADNKYRGYLSAVELMQDIGAEISFSEPGGVIVLQVMHRDYHLTQISQIVESEDARILGLHIARDVEDELMNLWLKIDQTDLSRIIRSLERYEYKILEVFHNSLFDDNVSDRYEAFMKYLNT